MARKRNQAQAVRVEPLDRGTPQTRFEVLSAAFDASQAACLEAEDAL